MAQTATKSGLSIRSFHGMLVSGRTCVRRWEPGIHLHGFGPSLRVLASRVDFHSSTMALRVVRDIVLAFYDC